MNRLLAIALAATFALTACSAEAQLFSRFRERRAGNSDYATPATGNCPGGVCPSPTGGGGLGVNRNGGFTGSLPDSYFEDYQRRMTGAPAASVATPQTMQAAPRVVYQQPIQAAVQVVREVQPAVKTIAVQQPAASEPDADADAELRKYLSTNTAVMRAMAEKLGVTIEAEEPEQPNNEAHKLLSALPLVRLSVIPKDGGEAQEANIDLSVVTRELLGAQQGE